MADNVVRRDVVEIGFDVESDPLLKLNKEMQNFREQVQDTNKEQKKQEEQTEKTTGKQKKQEEQTKRNTKQFKGLADTAKEIKGKLAPAVDAVDKSLKKVAKSATAAGKKIVGGIGKAGKAAFKGLTVSAGAFGAAMGFATKNFAEYEQLAGGAEKIFDKADMTGILNDANKAYLNLSMSANEYLAAINNTGATFAATMGDQKGYNTAKMGLQAISDYATGTGKDITELSDKYAMITRSAGSYQSIADQFSGILPATSADFLKQAQSAGFLSKKYTELTKVPIAEYQEAVTKMLKKGTDDLGLANNTLNEATNTLSGSIGMAKAAWTNFLTGMTDESQDFDALVGNVIDSVVAVAKNLIPKLKVLAPRLGKGIAEIGKELAPYIPPALKAIANKIVEYTPIVASKFKDMLFKAKDYLIQNKGVIWDGMKTAAAHALAMLGQLFTGQSFDVSGIKTKIQEIADKVLSFANGIKEHWPTIKGILIGVAGAVGAVKIAMLGVNTVIKISNGLAKAKAAADAIMAAKEKLLNASVWGSVKAFGAQAIALMTNPITWVVVGVVALIAALVMLVKNWDKVKAAASKCWKGIQDAFGKAADWFGNTVVKPVKNWFGNLFSNISEKALNVKTKIVDAFTAAKDGVCKAWSGITGFFKGIWENVVKSVATPVNKLIGGANWVLGKFGSDKKIAEWHPYAQGTNGHPGGNAIVNDGRGAELVTMPNGKSFIPSGRNVLMPNAPKGMKVLDAQQTARMMGRKSPTYHYEDGTKGGGFLSDIFSFFDDAKGLVGKVIDKFISFKDIGGYALDVAKALISTAKGAMTSWVKGLFKKFGGKSLDGYKPSGGVEQWRSTVTNALKMEGLFSAANVKRTLYQMQTESGGNPRAVNNWDSNARKGTPSKGLMQVIDPTFKTYARKGYASNIFDPMSNILASVRYAKSRYGSLERAYRGVGYAAGIGMPRVSLPVYTPSAAASSSSVSNSTNNYSPSFSLTMNGTTDRTTQRTIKRWIKEAFDEIFDSMERSNPRVQEV